MAYKKYIKRDGKVYGPYIYHSRKVHGKVITEYRGKVKKNFWNILFLLFVFALLIFVAVQKNVELKQTKLDANFAENLNARNLEVGLQFIITNFEIKWWIGYERHQ
jgi:hypothetical protein